MELSLPLKIGLSLILGAVIGLEREINEKKSLNPRKKPVAILGLRTFSLISGLGALTGILSAQYLPLAVLISGAFMVMTVVFYILDTQKTQDPGITTEIAMVYSFLIGLFLVFELIPIQMTIALSVLLILLLSRKEKIKSLVDDIRKEEVNAFVSYAIIALVVLPFLPNMTFALSDIPFIHTILNNFQLPAEKLADIPLFNPYKIWLIVALITGVDILGYVLERTLGQKKGWILASIAGGFISSTATTQALAKQSKAIANPHNLVSAAILSNMTSFFQIAIIIIAVNATFFAQLLPTLLAIISVSLIIVIFYLRKHTTETKRHKETEITIQSHEIFNIGPALKFAVLFLTITVVSKVALELFGNSGFLLTTALGALAGLDAVMINTAELAGKTIGPQLAVIAFIIANAINLIAKSFYSYLQGSKQFTLQFSLYVLITILGSLLGLLFV